MSIDVTELQKRINALVQQDPTSPTEGGDDWDIYLKYINMAQSEWQESYEWPTLYKEVNTMTSVITGNASITLPSDFRKFDGTLKIAEPDGNEYEYPQIDPQVRGMYDGSKHYSYILGSPLSYVLVVNPGSHSSGASISYSYWVNGNSLTSPTDVSMCPDPNYLVQRAVAYVWEARDDGRFPQAKAEADKILARMLENENVKGHSYDDRVRTTEELNYGFRIGRN